MEEEEEESSPLAEEEESSPLAVEKESSPLTVEEVLVDLDEERNLFAEATEMIHCHPHHPKMAAHLA